MKKLLFATLSIALASVISLFVMEFVVRMAIPAYDPSGHITFVIGKAATMKQVGYPLEQIGRPNSVQRQIKNTGDYDVLIRFNEYGFRDSNELSESTSKDFFVLGDSLSFGWGVEADKRISEQLEKITKTRFYNISIPGDLVFQKSLIDYAKKKGAIIKNLVILFSNEVRLKNYEKKTVVKTPVQTGLKLITVKRYLMSHSALYFLVTSFIHRVPALKKIAVDLGLLIPNLEGFQERDYDPVAVKSSSRKLANIAKDYATLVVLSPSRGIWSGTKRESVKKNHIGLIRNLEKLGVKVLDLVPAFEKDGAPLQKFFKNDGHWKAETHVFVAKLVAQYMKNYPSTFPLNKP